MNRKQTRRIDPVVYIASNAIGLIAVGMLLAALGRWPDTYYHAVRWAVIFATVLIWWRSFLQGDGSGRGVGPSILTGLMAVCFNPFCPVNLPRQCWEFNDVMAAIIFLGSLAVLEFQLRFSEKS